MIKLDLISVIIPIYNVEKYLRRCIDSIRKQTYENLQIILVNDGSADCCEHICKEYLKIDDRMEYIYQQNRGLAGARNTGIEHASGEYVVFVDSDDYVASNYVMAMYQWIKCENADIAVCGMKNTYDDAQEEDLIDYENYTVKSGVSYIRNMYQIPTYKVNGACNKMFRRRIFDENRFPEGTLFEDFVLMTKLLYEAKKIVDSDQVLYYYFQSTGSITRCDFSIKHLDRIKQFEKRLDFFKERGEQSLYNRCVQEYNVMLLKCYYCCKRYIKNSKKEQEKLLAKYYANLGLTLGAKENSFVKKIFFVMAAVFPFGMGFVVNDIMKL